MSAVGHVISTGLLLSPDTSIGYRARCSCGWFGRQDFQTEEAALDDGDEHIAAAT